MPLSEQEQRLLEEMERSLYHNDADYVAGASGRRGKPTYSRIVSGVLIGIVGIATLISGVAIRFPIVGVIGFVLMFVGVLLAVTPPRTSLAGRGPARPGADASPRASEQSGSDKGGTDKGGTDKGNGSFLQNLGDRWENRSTDERDE